MGECLIMRRGGEPYKLPILNTSYPQDITTTVIKGNVTSATFNVGIDVAGNPAKYTYQWYVNGSVISGANGSSYTMNNLSETKTYSIYCEVTNKAGTVASRVATLKVTQYYTPTLNSSYPANVSGASIGGSATFKVTIATAGNPASYTYQWYVNNSAVSGATSTSYTRSNLAAGTYSIYCKVTNAAGTVQSRTATLTVTKLYLYNSGDECTSTTGGWESIKCAQGYNADGPVYGQTAPVLERNSTNLTATNSTGCGIVYTVKKINLTNYKTLKMNGMFYTEYEARHITGLFIRHDLSGGYAQTFVKSITPITERNKEFSGEFSIDVSDCSGEYYICLGVGVYGYGDPYTFGVKAKVVMNSMWLEV